jgi:hypothetical protein
MSKTKLATHAPIGIVTRMGLPQLQLTPCL